MSFRHRYERLAGWFIDFLWPGDTEPDPATLRAVMYLVLPLLAAIVALMVILPLTGLPD